MKVNMTPNPLDVVTIHASQGDTEARQWEFELHNNGELIDTSEITEQLFFKAYKGGTEQLLPENGSTPTTSPFKGDIKYPQGLLTDQEFTYRQSPTEEDGLAKITDIKGNTLVWNQLLPSFATSTDYGMTWSYDNGLISVSGTATSSLSRKGIEISINTTHKYALLSSADNTGAPRFTLSSFSAGGVESSKRFGQVAQFTKSGGVVQLRITGMTVEETYNKSAYLMIIDLTQMFGAGNEPTSVDEFTSLFPLSYYSYNQGSLLSFMGNGIKTTGKNLVFKVISSANLGGDGTIVVDNHNIYDLAVAEVVEGKQYHIGNNRGDSALIGWFTSEPQIGSTSYDGQRIVGSTLIPIAPITGYIVFRIDKPFAKPTFNLGTGNIDYEPYTSSTLSLPISTYFPTGMKSAGSVYDELLPTKAITRVGSVDMGTLEWAVNNASANIFMARIDIKEPSDYEARKTGFINPKYPPSSDYAISPSMDDKSMLRLVGNIVIRDTAFSDVTALKTSLNGVYIHYELATESETSFTTASLVTENAEIPLSNEDGVLIGKCTEQLSENPGFFDVKIKLADADGECYSNKLQLHVERSPQ